MDEPTETTDEIADTTGEATDTTDESTDTTGEATDTTGEAAGEANRPQRIGYFGGSFDPPHRGHLAVARAARDRFHLDRVLLAPTARQPLKPKGPEASWTDRLRMTELLCAGKPGLEASTIDGPQPGGEPNYTADTLRRLRKMLDPRGIGLQLFAILGADAFDGLAHWREPTELFRLAEWIVVGRPGHDLPDRTQDETAATQRIHPLVDLKLPVSSTEVRARLQAGLDCTRLLPEQVMSFIAQRHLYTL